MPIPMSATATLPLRSEQKRKVPGYLQIECSQMNALGFSLSHRRSGRFWNFFDQMKLKKCSRC